MPLQEFWYDDPDLLWTYRNLYLNKIKSEVELQKYMMNYSAWLQGLYNRNAIVSAFNEKVKYFEKPIVINSKPKSIKEQKLEIAERIKIRAMQGQIILQQRGGQYKG